MRLPVWRAIVRDASVLSRLSENWEAGIPLGPTKTANPETFGLLISFSKVKVGKG